MIGDVEVDSLKGAMKVHCLTPFYIPLVPDRPLTV